jgi:hypothetical protein
MVFLMPVPEQMNPASRVVQLVADVDVGTQL